MITMAAAIFCTADFPLRWNSSCLFISANGVSFSAVSAIVTGLKQLMSCPSKRQPVLLAYATVGIMFPMHWCTVFETIIDTLSISSTNITCTTDASLCPGDSVKVCLPPMNSCCCLICCCSCCRWGFPAYRSLDGVPSYKFKNVAFY